MPKRVRFGVVLGWLVLPALAGCVSNPETSAPTRTAPTRHTEYDLSLIFAEHLVLFDAPPGSELTIRQSETQENKVRKNCEEWASASGQHYFWVTLWNRTGLVRYHEFLVNWSLDKPLDMDLRLPDVDPPFMVWAGLTCSGSVQVTFRADQWLLTDDSFGLPGYRHDGPLVVERFNATVEVRIPAGVTHGEGVLPLQGANFFIEQGFVFGEVTRTGQRMGDLFVYEPSEPPATGHWMYHSFWHALDDGWDLWHSETGTPGDYRFVVNLDAPYAMETVWTAKGTVWRFLPALADLGFSHPFDLYERVSARPIA